MNHPIPFPDNVRDFDWTQPPWPGPPKERTRIGYHRWAYTTVDCEDPDYGLACGVDYYVHPDGSAEIVRFGLDNSVEILAAGQWEVEYPSTSFGSRGGCFIRRRAAD